jgi:hypothetical protein
MSFIRTDGQAALNSMLKAARETLDHYRDGAGLDENIAQLFRDISRQRREFIRRLEDAVRATGDLPSVPDPDKEAGEMLIHHVAAMIKDNYAADLVEQRIEDEKELADQAIEAKDTELKTSHTSLLNEFSAHITETITRLESVHAQLVRQEE